MPRFTIAREGQVLSEVTLTGDRIELGSANTCPLFVDDLLIALKQGVFIKDDGGRYRLEPLTQNPSMKLADSVVDSPQVLEDGASVVVEGYTITINYESAPAAKLTETLPEAGPADAPESSKMSGESPPSPPDEPELPAPLTPDLPSPLEPESPQEPELPPISVPSESVAQVPDNAPKAPPSPVSAEPDQAPERADDQERTVFVRTIGMIVATAGPLAGKEWGLRSGEIRIGRDPTKNEIAVRFDANGKIDSSVSRRHASIHVIGDQVFVEDQGSAAGTFVNGQKAPAGERVPVKDKDQIEIRSARDSTILEIRITVGSAAPSTPPPPLPSPPPKSAPPLPPAAPPAELPPELAPPPPQFNPPEYVRDDGPGFDPIFSGGEPRSPKPGAASTKSSEDDQSGSESPGMQDDNPFQPIENTGVTGTWPKWIWVLVVVGVVVIAGVLLLVLGE